MKFSLRRILVLTLLIGGGLGLLPPTTRTAIGQGQISGLTPENAARFAQLLKQDWKEKPEWAEMLTAILNGEPMGANSGWFRPSKKRLGWKWFSKQFDKDGDGKVTRKEGNNFRKVFASIDRDRNGVITEADFDWDKVNHVVPSKPSEAIFFMLDRDSNGRVDQKEVLDWMAKMDQEKKGFLTPDEFSLEMAAMDRFAKSMAEDSSKTAKTPKPKPPAGDPNRMLNMLFRGDLGSFTEGPGIGEMAPDFDLPRLKQEGTTKLSSFKGKSIVVLNFGSFT